MNYFYKNLAYIFCVYAAVHFGVNCKSTAHQLDNVSFSCRVCKGGMKTETAFEKQNEQTNLWENVIRRTPLFIAPRLRLSQHG